MSNNYNSTLQSNSTDLQAILNQTITADGGGNLYYSIGWQPS